MEKLRDKYSDDAIKQIFERRTEKAVLKEVSKETGIPRDYVGYTAKMALNPDGDIAAMLHHRLNLLGKARVRELLDNPEEVARLADLLGADPDDVTDAAEDIVDVVETELKVPGVLLKHIADPNAANMAMNQPPDYPALNAVASEMKVKFGWLAKIVDGLRPKENQGKYLEALLKADPIAQNELPNVAEFMLKAWAVDTGVSVDFLKQRCAAIHQAAELEKARLKAEADAKAKAKRKAKRKKKKAEEARKAKEAEEAKKAEQKSKQVFKPVALKQAQIPRDVEQRIFGQLLSTGHSEQKIWELANDLPGYKDLAVIAKDLNVSVQNVIDTAVFYFTSHTGTMLLAECFRQIPTDEVDLFRGGNLPEDRFNELVDQMAKMTGLAKNVVQSRFIGWA
jgi:hypothetical protein